MTNKSNFLLLGAMLLCFCAMAQGTGTVPTDTWSDYLLSVLKSGWFQLVVIAYEIAIRVTPTGKTYSIITFVFRMLSMIAPDKMKDGGTFGIRVLLLMFLCYSSTVSAQKLKPNQKYTVSEVQKAISNGDEIGIHSTNYAKTTANGRVVKANPKTLTLDTLAVAIGGSSTGGVNIGYKVYKAVLSQSDFSEPIPTVFANTVGNVTWQRNAVGQYSLVLPSNMNLQNCLLFLGVPQDGSTGAVLHINTSIQGNIVNLSSFSNFGVLDDNLIQKLPIEIQVYE